MAFEFVSIWSTSWEDTFLLRFFLAFVSLFFAATLFSIYQQERKIPALSRVVETMVESARNFPFVWATRLTHAPSRLKHSVQKGKRRVASRVQKSFSKRKGNLSKRIHAWAAKHVQPSKVKVSVGKQSLNLNAALHQFTPGTLFTFSPDSLVERYTQAKWHVYEARQGKNKVWLLSPKPLKKGILRVKLRHSKRGYYLEA